MSAFSLSRGQGFWSFTVYWIALRQVLFCSVSQGFQVQPPASTRSYEAPLTGLFLSDWSGFSGLGDDDVDDRKIDTRKYAAEEDSQQSKAIIGAKLNGPSIENDAPPIEVPVGKFRDSGVGVMERFAVSRRSRPVATWGAAFPMHGFVDHLFFPANLSLEINVIYVFRRCRIPIGVERGRGNGRLVCLPIRTGNPLWIHRRESRRWHHGGCRLCGHGWSHCGGKLLVNIFMVYRGCGRSPHVFCRACWILPWLVWVGTVVGKTEGKILAPKNCRVRAGLQLPHPAHPRDYRRYG